MQLKAAERRAEILKILCRRRYETISVLAAEFNDSERTIRRDIESLSLTAPLYTKTGRYEGGVYILDDYTKSVWNLMQDSKPSVKNGSLYKTWKPLFDNSRFVTYLSTDC